MRENNELTNLFKSRLSQTEMEVRDGFWEALEQELDTFAPATQRKRVLSRRIVRWMVAASFLLGVGITTFLWWKPAPAEENETMRRLASASSEALGGGEEGEEVSSLPVHRQAESIGNRGVHRPVWSKTVAQAEAPAEDPVSVHVSITITQRQYGHRPSRKRTSYSLHPAGEGFTAGEDRSVWTASSDEQASMEDCSTLLKSSRWALKAGLGTSLPKGDYHAPLTVGLGVEYQLNKRLSLEAGVQYGRLAEADGESRHTLGIPLRLNILLAGNSKVDFYALAGGAVEKCVAGAPDNGFDAEPVQGSVMAGLGVRYKMSDRLALFAEPTVSHHFDTDASTPSLHTERPTNLNLLCGLRMAF